jgi:hypothetical protein
LQSPDTVESNLTHLRRSRMGHTAVSNADDNAWERGGTSGLRLSLRPTMHFVGPAASDTRQLSHFCFYVFFPPYSSNLC